MTSCKLKTSLATWGLSILILLLITPAFAAPDTHPQNDASTSTSGDATKKGPTGAFVASFSTIVVSELGDKTFFIAAIMAMRYNRIAVLSGALFALFLMTGISTAFGSLVTTLVPEFYTHVITTGLFFFFGVKLLYDAYHDEGTQNNEKSEVEMELNQLHSKMMEKKSKNTLLEQEMRKPSIEETSDSTENGSPQTNEEFGKLNGKNFDLEANPKGCATHIEQVATKLVFWQALTLTFLGEWGDRSQISTIALAANSNALLVFIGSFLGHCLCTGLAVMGGKYLAKRISERMVNICGGVLFLIFGIHNLIAGRT